MKTAKTIFVAVALTLMSAQVMAAPGVREIRNKVIESDKTAINRETIRILKGTTDAQAVSRGSQVLSELSGQRASAADLKEAIIRGKISYETPAGSQTVKVGDIAKRLLKIDQAIKEIRETNADMTKAAKDHLTALEEAVSVGAQFIALGARTTDRVRLAATLTATDKLMLNAFYKQLSILGEVGTMETADLKAHTKIMADAVRLQDGPKGTGDLAFYTALRESVGKDQNKLNKKLNELLGCI